MTRASEFDLARPSPLPARADAAAAAALPRLAYVYNDWFGPWAVKHAAAGVCEPVWVVTGGEADVRATARMLRRLGTVVDVTGMGVDEAALAIGAHGPAGIATSFDGALVWTAEVAHRLGLPFMGAPAARRLTDKLAQREALRDAGLPGPRFWPVAALDDAPAWHALAREATFPAVLKPRCGWASRDTVRVRSLDQVRAIVADICRRDGSSDPDMILEEYLGDRASAGDTGFAGYVSVESVVSEGRISHVAITGRPPLVEPFREGGAFIPSALGAADRARVTELATAALTAIEMQTGCAHTEIKLTPDGPRVIELNGRIGGPIPALLEAATGVQLLPIAMRIALGETVSFDTIPIPTHVAYMLAIYAPAAMQRVAGVDGIDALRAHPDIAEVVLHRGPGDAVDWREGSAGRVVSVSGSVADHDALRQTTRFVDEHLRIRGG